MNARHDLMAAVIAAVLVFGLYLYTGRISSTDHLRRNRTTSLRPLRVCWYLLTAIPVLAAIGLLGRERGAEAAGTVLMTFFFQNALPAGIYYSVLLFLIPLLRRWISAAVCAVLWLLPALLVCQQVFGALQLAEPQLVIRVGADVLPALLILWGFGAAAVLLHSVIQHRRLVRILEKDMRPPAPEVQALWEQEQQSMRVEKGFLFPLHVSGSVGTPVTIGLFRGKMNVLIPDRVYTEQELRLIFRHELIHIRREDTKTKFFLTVCKAVNWFNPLMWPAVRRCAEDLELSCDEEVLRFENAKTRELYGELLLRTAAAPGFTTCLSASAKSLRYRLQQVIPARRKITGLFAAGLLAFLLLAADGRAALAWDAAPAGERVPELLQLGTGEHGLRMIQLGTGESYTGGATETGSGEEMVCRDEAALGTYLRSLTAYRMTGDYRLPIEGKVLELDFFEEGWKEIYVFGRWIVCVRYNEDVPVLRYMLEEEPDWNMIESLLEPTE